MTFIDPAIVATAQGLEWLGALEPAFARHLRELGQMRISVSSTAIAAISYDLERTMTIEFADGSRYSFPGFSVGELARFLAAPSKGKYFNSNIRGRF